MTVPWYFNYMPEYKHIFLGTKFSKIINSIQLVHLFEQILVDFGPVYIFTICLVSSVLRLDVDVCSALVLILSSYSSQLRVSRSLTLLGRKSDPNKDW